MLVQESENNQKVFETLNELDLTEVSPLLTESIKDERLVFNLGQNFNAESMKSYFNPLSGQDESLLCSSMAVYRI